MNLPLYVKPQIHFSGQSGRVNVMVGPKANLAGRTIEDVIITIPFSKGIASTNLSVNHGTAHFDDATKVGPPDTSPNWTLHTHTHTHTHTYTRTHMHTPCWTRWDPQTRPN